MTPLLPLIADSLWSQFAAGLGVGGDADQYAYDMGDISIAWEKCCKKT
jgi:hypothetical protein